MPPFSLPMLLAVGLLIGILPLLRKGRRGRRSRAFVEVHPRYRLLLRRQGLTEPRHFLDLSAAVVSGHPGRNVARVTLTAGDEAINAFLKRESRVSWRVRLMSAAAGFGFVSRSLREAQNAGRPGARRGRLSGTAGCWRGRQRPRLPPCPRDSRSDGTARLAATRGRSCRASPPGAVLGCGSGSHARRRLHAPRPLFQACFNWAGWEERSVSRLAALPTASRSQ